jgi:hypothetical protein
LHCQTPITITTRTGFAALKDMPAIKDDRKAGGKAS